MPRGLQISEDLLKKHAWIFTESTIVTAVHWINLALAEAYCYVVLILSLFSVFAALSSR